MTELTAQVAQEDGPDFLYKDWFFGTPEIVAEKIYRMTQYAGVSYLNLYLQPGPDPAREDHAVHGAVLPRRSCPTSAPIGPTRQNTRTRTTLPIPKGISRGRKECQ